MEFYFFHLCFIMSSLNNMKYFLILCIFCLGCAKAKKLEFNKKYVVVSSFNETVLETNDKAEAYEAAHNLTLFGRVFSSKPCYFVLEKESSLDKDFSK